MVNIKVVKKVEKVGFGQPDISDEPFHDFFEKFFQGRPQTSPAPRLQKGMGSGVIISQDGYVLTNNHVVEGAKDVIITLADQKEYKGRIVGTDPQTDIAVVKIDAQESFPAATLGDSENLKVGDWVVAIGNPFGLEQHRNRWHRQRPRAVSSAPDPTTTLSRRTPPVDPGQHRSARCREYDR